MVYSTWAWAVLAGRGAWLPFAARLETPSPSTGSFVSGALHRSGSGGGGLCGVCGVITLLPFVIVAAASAENLSCHVCAVMLPDVAANQRAMVLLTWPDCISLALRAAFAGLVG